VLWVFELVSIPTLHALMGFFFGDFDTRCAHLTDPGVA
jgi:hypothetical protein